MAYLEKRLETMKIHLGKGTLINSLLEFYNKNFRQHFLKQVLLNCDTLMINRHEELKEVYIYGEICGSSKGGKEQEKKPDICSPKKVTLLPGGKCLNVFVIW